MVFDKLSIVIITYNEALNIRACLNSVVDVADEIVVVDSFSTDETEEICKQFKNLTFIQNMFVNFSVQKQFAIDKANNHWVLSLDADEFLRPELIAEILKMKSTKLNFNAFFIRRSTFYQGHELNFCGTHSEKHLRLFNKNAGAFTKSRVHEKFVTSTPKGFLKNKIVHNPYRNLTHHLEKINNYTDLFASQQPRPLSCSMLKVTTKCTLRFLTIYFVKLAILDGYSGFIWAVMGSYYSFLKYAKIYEISKLEQHIQL